jgi:3-deoxy-D-arabino-heptulosonate 7-phosphate (DAHP) synthase
MSIAFKDALAHLENKRVKSTRPLIPPQILQEDLPLYVLHTLRKYFDPHICVSTFLGAQTVLEGRLAAEKILHAEDDRLMVVVGCGILFYINVHISL